MTMKIENIAFWILILSAIALSIWKLFESPSDIATIISIASLSIGSELLIWKEIFKIDKKTAIGFIKLKTDLERKIESSTDEIKELINNK